MSRFQYLSAPQITRLVFGTKVLTYVRDQLKTLHDDGRVRRLYLPRREPGGKSLAIYTLTAAGARYLRMAGVQLAGKVVPPSGEHEWLYLKHTLEANDLLVQCHHLPRLDHQAQLIGFETERELKRRPGETLIERRRTAVIPDGWAHLRRGVHDHYLSFELDRGTQEQKAFKKKIRAWASFLESGYARRFGALRATVAVVTTHSDNRLSYLVYWTEQELEARGLQEYADIFLFAHLEPSKVHPAHFFSAPIWYQPFVEQPVRLLEESHDEDGHV